MNKRLLSTITLLFFGLFTGLAFAQTSKTTLLIRDVFRYSDGSTLEVSEEKEGQYSEIDIDQLIAEAKTIPDLQSRIVEAIFFIEKGHKKRKRYYYTNIEPNNEPAEQSLYSSPQQMPGQGQLPGLDSLFKHMPEFDFDSFLKQFNDLHSGQWSITPLSSSPYFGVHPIDNEGHGVRVRAVFPDSPAEKSGILEGDIILRIDDEAVNSTAEIQKVIRSKVIGDVIKIELIRHQHVMILFAELRENNPSKGINNIMDVEPFEQQDPHQANQWPFKKKKSIFGITVVELENYSGLKVSDVEKDSPADRAGIMVDDVIYKFDRKKVNDATHLKSLVKDKSGETIKVKIIRDGKKQNIAVELDSIHE